MARAHHPRRRGRGLASLAAVAILAGILSSTTPTSAHDLTPSNVDATDGNQIVNVENPVERDWESFLPDTNADNLFRATDLASGATDNSLIGGTKDNTECPGSGTGSIPSNKDDLLRFYLFHETLTEVDGTGTDTFLYLGYVRSLPGTTTASAHGVFELNKLNTKCPSTTKGGVTTPSDFYVRTDGDVRLAFDDEGGNQPIISVQRWNEPCPGNKGNDTSGCWSLKTPLSAHQAEGSFNGSTIADKLFGAGTTNLGPESFAEMKVNMDTSGLLNSASCVGFGVASLFTGSSGNSDNEQTKDYVAPIPINLNNCQPATVNVTKRDGTTNGALLAGATLGLYNDTTNNNVFDASGVSADTLATVETGSDANPCTTNATDDPSCTWSVKGSATSNYIIHESGVPAGYTAAPDIPFDVTFSGSTQTFNFTMVDPRAPRNLVIRKVDDDSPAVGVGGAVFQLYKDDGDGVFDADDAIQTGKTCTSAGPGVNLGNCTITGVDTGFSYWVVETSRPAGYSADPNASVCTIGGTARSCLLVSVPVGTGDIGPTGLTFVNPREFTVVTFVCKEADSSLYQSGVNFDAGATEQSISSVPTALANKGVTAADLCTAWAANAARFDDQARGAHDSDVTIPQ